MIWLLFFLALGGLVLMLLLAAGVLFLAAAVVVIVVWLALEAVVRVSAWRARRGDSDRVREGRWYRYLQGYLEDEERRAERGGW